MDISNFPLNKKSKIKLKKLDKGKVQMPLLSNAQYHQHHLQYKWYTINLSPPDYTNTSLTYHQPQNMYNSIVDLVDNRT